MKQFLSLTTIDASYRRDQQDYRAKMISKLEKMRLFGPQHKTKAHFLALLLIIIIMALSGARLLLSGRKNRTRASSMGLGMV